ncbi:hypothetical protein BD770DRAFT_383456 [Pilaira anomala]|nr:hypothetical protein BD770DRAFT_383456 [Pilaira anomala]
MRLQILHFLYIILYNKIVDLKEPYFDKKVFFVKILISGTEKRGVYRPYYMHSPFVVHVRKTVFVRKSIFCTYKKIHLYIQSSAYLNLKFFGYSIV